MAKRQGADPKACLCGHAHRPAPACLCRTADRSPLASASSAIPWRLAPGRTWPPLHRAALTIHDATSDFKPHFQRPLMPSSPSGTTSTKEPKSENSPPLVGATEPLELQSHAKRAQDYLPFFEVVTTLCTEAGRVCVRGSRGSAGLICSKHTRVRFSVLGDVSGGRFCGNACGNGEDSTSSPNREFFAPHL